jgi:carboxymethylenebutenolidase
VADLPLPWFVARPAADPPWPGVLVIHEGNGVSPQLLRCCERLAADGYAALAPDLFFRSGGTEAADFSTLIGALRPSEIERDLADAHRGLRELGADRVAMIGFCLGGSIAYRAAGSDLDLACAVPFYGAQIAAETARPRCPILIVFGGDDEYIPSAEIAAVRDRHGDHVVVYPDAGHGFMRDGSPSYDERAATDAWARMRALFDARLR